MDALKIKRIPLRSAFTKTLNGLNEILNYPSPDVNTIEQLLDQLVDKSKKLSAVDKEILNFMLINKVYEKDYTKEFEACGEYNEKLIKMKQICIKPKNIVHKILQMLGEWYPDHFIYQK